LYFVLVLVLDDIVFATRLTDSDNDNDHDDDDKGGGRDDGEVGKVTRCDGRLINTSFQTNIF